ncbi:arsinothricin resistance N-acetyltransferase ArsN1 family B [Aquimarina agarivorans]|uniref:arsinothricin resistance N-acetyltransferase ArsN1 family B n=1 Tax=Aquimarina agarivorans TaxID=980584 RepID=UPI000248EB9D|nr:arsinothricin resistance N-acetyltransferase ArsN1 family B [Aquimarina agarivorans]
MVRKASVSHDAAAVAEIYNYYILNSVVTFEETPIDANEMKQRMESVVSASYPWLVYEISGEVVGYAYATRWKGRCAYKHSVESTVYLKNGKSAQGIGTALYTELLKLLMQKNIHAIIGGVALPNAASVCLHEKFDFQKVAHFKEVGFKFQKWIDVAYWQLTLDNRKILESL